MRNDDDDNNDDYNDNVVEYSLLNIMTMTMIMTMIVLCAILAQYNGNDDSTSRQFKVGDDLNSFLS